MRVCSGNALANVLGIVPGGSGAERAHHVLAERIPGYRVVRYSPSLEYWPPALLSYRRLPRRLTHVPPDHAYLVTPSGAPLFVTFHNYVLDAAMKPYSTITQRIHYATDLRFLVRRALRGAWAVSAVSRATAERVREDLDYAGRIDIIPNGVDTGVFYPVHSTERREEPLRVLFSGNTTRRKGAQWLPRIVELLECGADVWVTGGLRQSNQLSAVSDVRILGQVAPSEMPALYRQVDVLLAPSVREGMSLAVLEAMASGLPVVASDIPSMREVVAPGAGGFLCPVGDVEAFSGAIDRLAADPELRRAMGKYNRTRIEREHTIERMAERYRAAFASVLGHG